MKAIRTRIDVSMLPTFAFGNRGLVWWGTIGFIVIEGFSLALCVASYLYLRKNLIEWPPPRVPNPDLLLPTIGLVVMLLSNLPMYMVKKAALALDRAGVTRWLLVACAFGIAMVVFRVYDFAALNTRWDNNAYGSITWTTVGFHAALVLMEVGETVGALLLFLFAPIEEKHFVDASDNVMYWAFVTLSWIPLYVLVYLVPRWT